MKCEERLSVVYVVTYYDHDDQSKRGSWVRLVAGCARTMTEAQHLKKMLKAKHTLSGGNCFNYKIERMVSVNHLESNDQVERTQKTKKGENE